MRNDYHDVSSRSLIPGLVDSCDYGAPLFGTNSSMWPRQESWRVNDQSAPNHSWGPANCCLLRVVRSWQHTPLFDFASTSRQPRRQLFTSITLQCASIALIWHYSTHFNLLLYMTAPKEFKIASRTEFATPPFNMLLAVKEFVHVTCQNKCQTKSTGCSLVREDLICPCRRLRLSSPQGRPEP
ncbi:uncharacterized protein CC84DRAFT_793476 [Paraphaeosphaeria sporulosa]|uniref:Uncharacterized protein n=1 Tax=Paraphaeosphaeria sporulosa TaxID=1460663 RepID=A0A177CC70_9PLEO|nr:uncharacterized protein CC84DRAFT_793476 [Paraphaeosphaeria sporulosa]OAG04472.1 hypothetical protein CC84DRAFT_793476 [Paraphaeosphaeria sporulosa]